RLEALKIKETSSGKTERVAAGALFVLIGAGTHTAWLEGLVQRDEHGFSLNGRYVVRGIGGCPEWVEVRAPHTPVAPGAAVFCCGARPAAVAARRDGGGSRRRGGEQLGARVSGRRELTMWRLTMPSNARRPPGLRGGVRALSGRGVRSPSLPRRVLGARPGPGAARGHADRLRRGRRHVQYLRAA